jgi:hypothetical protein
MFFFMPAQEINSNLLLLLKRITMSKCLAFLLLSCFTCSSLYAQSTDEKDLADRIETLRQVMIRPDKAILDDIASNDIIYVHSSGTVRDKQGFIDEFMKGWSVYTAITLSNQVIKIAGNNAIVRHRLEADTKKDNMPPHIDIIILMVWTKENGKWKLLARQAAKIPAT